MDTINRSVLIVGLDSKIGRALSNYLGDKKFNVWGTSRRGVGKKTFLLDLAYRNSNFPRIHFDTVIICAGITNVSDCEEHPVESEIVNVYNTIKLIDKLLEDGSYVIFLSSNSVFDGTKTFNAHNDSTKPVSNYGKYKVKVEEYLQNQNKSAAVLRLTKVMTANPEFVERWEEACDEGVDILAYKNRFFSPITIGSVVETIHLMLDKEPSGIFQLGGTEEISYFEYAKLHFSHNAKKLKLIKGVEDPSMNHGRHNSLRTHLPF